MNGERKRKFTLLIDFLKAFDSVDRMVVWKLLKKRWQSQQERSIVDFIMKLHNYSTILVGTHSMEAEMELPQGSILSPFLFNEYLEEALKSSENSRK
jgi:hypothetical protein